MPKTLGGNRGISTLEVAILGAACLAWAGLWAYTRAVQEATLFWGIRLRKDNPLLPATGMQDAITPRSQTARNILCMTALVAIPIVGVWRLGWPAGVGGTVMAVVVSSLLRSLLPKPGSPYLFSVIVRGLSRRRAAFARASDTAGVEAASTAITRLKTEFEAVHGRPAA